jgi:endoglucanase
VWGSNGNISDNGITLTMAYDATGKQKYRQAAIEQVSYLLGRNSLDTCFVSGFGTPSIPQNVHSRIAKVNDAILLGSAGRRAGFFP